MEGRRKHTRKRLAAAVCLAVCLISCFFVPKAVGGLWTSDQAVHVKDGDVENSTLAIGTHLIHISALTEELYVIALKSAEDSMQNQVFYKSELAGGTWFDITSASKLEDISTAGKPVKAEEVCGLYYEYHTKSDGTTYDLRTKKAVNIFNIRSPYDLEAMEELQPIKIQYDILYDKEELSDVEEWCQGLFTGIFRTNIQKSSVGVMEEETGEFKFYSGEDTEERDKDLDALQQYLDVLNTYKAGADEREEVSSVMESVDAARRLIIYQIIYDKVYGAMEALTGTDEPLEEGYVVSSEILDAVNEAISNLNNSIIEAEGKLLAEGNTVLSESVYTYSSSLISDASAQNHQACDQDVEYLLALKHITDGNVGSREKELELLDQSLLQKAGERYRTGLGRGENSEYLTAKRGQAAAVLLKSIREDALNTVNTYRNELEFLVDAKCMRMENTASQDYIKQCISEAAGFYGKIAKDDFYEPCRASVDEYLEWLNGKLNHLVQGGGGSEADQLAVQKADLQSEYMEALDDNDLEQAAVIQKQIDELDEKLAALASSQAEEVSRLEQEISGLKQQLSELASGDSVRKEQLIEELGKKEAEAAARKSAMSSGSIGGQVASLKENAKKAITSDPDAQTVNQLTDAIHAMGELLDLDYKTVFPSLTELYSQMVRERDLNGSQAYDQAIAQVEELILNNQSAYEAAMSGEVSADEVSALAGEYFGEEDSGKWTEEQTAVFLAAGQILVEGGTEQSGGGTKQSGGGTSGGKTSGTGAGGTGVGTAQGGTSGTGSGGTAGEASGTGGASTAGGMSGTGGAGTAGGTSGTGGAGTAGGASGTGGAGTAGGTSGTGGAGTAGGTSGTGGAGMAGGDASGAGSAGTAGGGASGTGGIGTGGNSSTGAGGSQSGGAAGGSAGADIGGGEHGGGLSDGQSGQEGSSGGQGLPGEDETSSSGNEAGTAAGGDVPDGGNKTPGGAQTGETSPAEGNQNGGSGKPEGNNGEAGAAPGQDQAGGSTGTSTGGGQAGENTEPGGTKDGETGTNEGVSDGGGSGQGNSQAGGENALPTGGMNGGEGSASGGTQSGQGGTTGGNQTGGNSVSGGTQESQGEGQTGSSQPGSGDTQTGGGSTGETGGGSSQAAGPSGGQAGNSGSGGSGTSEGTGNGAGTDSGMGGGAETGAGTDSSTGTGDTASGSTAGSSTAGEAGTGSSSGGETESGAEAENGAEAESGAGTGLGTGGESKTDDNGKDDTAYGQGASIPSTRPSASKRAGQDVEGMMAAMAAAAYLRGNPLVFLRIDDPACKYIPVQAIARYKGMRYLWNSSKNKATLAAGSKYYEFTLFSNQVKVGKTEADILKIPHAPRIKTTLHIPEDFAVSEFGCGAVYLKGSQYGILYTKEMMEQAKELCSVLEGGV